MTKKADNSRYVPYIILLSIGIVLAFTQNYLVSTRFNAYYSDWIFFLPLYLTSIHLLLFYLFGSNPKQTKFVFMLGSAVRLLVYLIPTFIYIFITSEKSQRLFFVVLIFIYYFCFTLADSILKMRQQKKIY